MNMIWHFYGSNALASECGKWRIYKRAIKNSDLFKYTLHRVMSDGSYKRVGEGVTAKAMQQLVDDWTKSEDFV